MSLTPARVLVVDDSPTLRRVVGTILQQHGYDAWVAADGLQALSLLERAGAETGPDPRAVRLAAWFHDAVYVGDPAAPAGQDEADSAALARDVLTDPRLAVPADVVDEVARLVLLTAAHDPAPHDAMAPRLVVTAGIAVASASVVALLAVLASGSLGPGSLAQVGPAAGPLALAVGLEVAVGAAIVLLAPRRRQTRDADGFAADADRPSYVPPVD